MNFWQLVNSSAIYLPPHISSILPFSIFPCCRWWVVIGQAYVWLQRNKRHNSHAYEPIKPYIFSVELKERTNNTRYTLYRTETQREIGLTYRDSIFRGDVKSSINNSFKINGLRASFNSIASQYQFWLAINDSLGKRVSRKSSKNDLSCRTKFGFCVDEFR